MISRTLFFVIEFKFKLSILSHNNLPQLFLELLCAYFLFRIHTQY
jgi:hypothetical protein